MSVHQPGIEELSSLILPAKVVSKTEESEDLPSPRLLFNAINRYETVPFERVSLHAGRESKRTWLNDCLGHVSFKDKCFLFVVQYGWRWFQVESAEPEEWILSLLLRSDIDDFMVLSQDVTGFLGFVEAEAKYLAFLSKHIR